MCARMKFVAGWRAARRARSAPSLASCDGQCRRRCCQMWCSTGRPPAAARSAIGSSSGSSARRAAASFTPMAPAATQRSISASASRESLGLTATYQRIRSGWAVATASIASFPSRVSDGDWKYVGDHRPQEPRMDAMCVVMPMRSPARNRASLSALQSARPHPAKKKWACTSTSGPGPASGAVIAVNLRPPRPPRPTGRTRCSRRARSRPPFPRRAQARRSCRRHA
jgi:hypothetical protein